MTPPAPRSSRIAGLGFRADAPSSSLRAALALAEAAGGPVQGLATLPAKAGAPVLMTLAAERGLPVHGVEVAGIDTPTRSDRILSRHATGSVAEAAALAAAGPGARLLVARVTAPDGMATAAIAETAAPGGGGDFS